MLHSQSYYALSDVKHVISGGWWSADVLSDIKGSIAIESGNHRYIEPQDNGLLKLGESHDIGKTKTIFYINCIHLIN